MEITGKQHRHGGLAHTALLVAQGDECASFAHKLSNCGLIIVFNVLAVSSFQRLVGFMGHGTARMAHPGLVIATE